MIIRRMSFETYRRIENYLKQYLPNDIAKHCIMPKVLDNFCEIWQLEHRDKMSDLHRHIDKEFYTRLFLGRGDSGTVHDRVFCINYDCGRERAQEFLENQDIGFISSMYDRKIMYYQILIEASKIKKRWCPQWNSKTMGYNKDDIDWLQARISKLKKLRAEGTPWDDDFDDVYESDVSDNDDDDDADY